MSRNKSQQFDLTSQAYSDQKMEKVGTTTLLTNETADDTFATAFKAYKDQTPTKNLTLDRSLIEAKYHSMINHRRSNDPIILSG